MSRPMAEARKRHMNEEQQNAAAEESLNTPVGEPTVEPNPGTTEPAEDQAGETLPTEGD